ncbi:hypothetical protein [Nocardia sp. NPDC050710]|uniref:hypothetical protein n=1 Tax=Nocardia sp. NPDC050710 TaxID=3157220 RepID=UPI0033C99A77
MATVTDEPLLSADQERLLRIVVHALMRQLDVHATVAERISPAPPAEDVETVLRILALPAVGYLRGMTAEVLAYAGAMACAPRRPADRARVRQSAALRSGECSATVET